jgi:hypothetical protein
MTTDKPLALTQIIGFDRRNYRQFDSKQYDDDYTFFELQNLLSKEQLKKICQMKEKQKYVSSSSIQKLSSYVQYFILCEFINNPMFWHRHCIDNDHWTNAPKKEYNEFIAKLSEQIQTKFFLETNPRILDHQYLRQNFKNKRCQIAYCVRNILKECPELYNNDHQILKQLSKTYQGRFLYSTEYYGNCIRKYKKKYGTATYPVERIDIKQYLFFIKFIKDTMM